MIAHSNYPKEAGIYKLTCVDNGKIYIGKTVNFARRFREHKSSKNAKCHFQNAVKKHGWDSFNIEILEIVKDFDKTKDNDKLLRRESYYIELFNSSDKNKGYNVCKFSNDVTGLPRSLEHREKLRQCNLGRIFSDEHKEKIRQSKIGVIPSIETREKLSKSRIGKNLSNDTKEKIRDANLGKKLSEETKEKIRIGNTGRILSEETKEKIRQKMVGRVFSDETREKFRQSALKRYNKENKNNK